MSESLVTCLIAVATNLVGILVICAITADLLVRLAWNGRGIVGILIMILLAQLFWIGPAMLIVNPRANPDDASSYALWFGNWIVSAFALVLLCRTARNIPRQLQDSARLDGLGVFATWRTATLPFCSRDLLLIAILTVMATLLPYLACITLPEAGNSIVIYQRFLSASGRIAMMAVSSVLGALPLFALFFLEKPRR
jgi:ABC-type glycerol-3-phosphate transport system permease component